MILHSPGFILTVTLTITLLYAIIASFSPTHVFHLATTGVGDLPLSYFESNISGVRNVINALSSCDSLLRVIFASSLLVCKVGYIPDSFDEYLPTTNYGVSKMKGELIVKSEAHNMDWVIVRPISIWGLGILSLIYSFSVCTWWLLLQYRSF